MNAHIHPAHPAHPAAKTIFMVRRLLASLL
jgi:hypothetical protein